MYKIDKVGNVYECNIDPDDLNKYLDDLKKSLTENYYNLESICKAEADYSPMYTTVFMGSTISVPLELIEETYVGTIADYQYYEELYINYNFRVHHTMKVRVKDFKYSYFIDDTRERLPIVLINKIKKLKQYSETSLHSDETKVLLD